jgi:hypothetical protein
VGIILRGSANSTQASTPSTSPDDSSTPTSPTPSTDAPGQLTKEEWSKINQLLSYQPGEDVLNASKTDGPNMMQISFDVNIRQGSARVLDSENKEILCGTFESLQVGIRVYPKTLACKGKLQFYGLSAPEGMLIEVKTLKDIFLHDYGSFLTVYSFNRAVVEI